MQSFSDAIHWLEKHAALGTALVAGSIVMFVGSLWAGHRFLTPKAISAAGARTASSLPSKHSTPLTLGFGSSKPMRRWSRKGEYTWQMQALFTP